MHETLNLHCFTKQRFSNRYLIIALKTFISLFMENKGSLVFILRKTNQTHILKFNLFNFLFNIILPFTPQSPEWFLSPRYSDQNFVFNSHFFHACLACHILLELIVLIISAKERKLWSFSLCNFLQYPLTYYPPLCSQ
jgi:hypothetical protein